jgi:hypothetical protein
MRDISQPPPKQPAQRANGKHDRHQGWRWFNRITVSTAGALIAAYMDAYYYGTAAGIHWSAPW